MNQANTQAVKVALITGAARRIGAAIATHLHQAGYKVLIHCNHSRKDAELLAQNLNGQRMDSAHIIQKNLTAPAAAQEIIKMAASWSTSLDLLVNNASVFTRTSCLEEDNTQWQALFDINVKAPYQLSLAAYPLLAATQGCIINLADIHGEKPLKEYGVYCQTKAALIMQTKVLAREFAPRVRVNAISPGAIAWPEEDNSLDAKMQQQIIAKTPLKRHGAPLFIAQAVLSLAENPFITGQVLKVDGGRSIS